jgi:hypothetical protein
MQDHLKTAPRLTSSVIPTLSFISYNGERPIPFRNTTIVLQGKRCIVNTIFFTVAEGLLIERRRLRVRRLIVWLRK